MNQSSHPALFRRVPRFFFHLFDDRDVIDDEGVELPNAQAARAKAQVEACHMACAEVLDGHLNLNHRKEVADERGDVVPTVSFGETVTVES